jgi:hypothetical protein
MNAEKITIEEPRIAKLLFSDPRFGWLWLPPARANHRKVNR